MESTQDIKLLKRTFDVDDAFDLDNHYPSDSPLHPDYYDHTVTVRRGRVTQVPIKYLPLTPPELSSSYYSLSNHDHTYKICFGLN